MEINNDLSAWFRERASAWEWPCISVYAAGWKTCAPYPRRQLLRPVCLFRMFAKRGGALCSDDTSLICQMRRNGGTLTTEKVGRLVDFSVLFFRLRRRSVFLHRFSNYICTIIVITVKREEYSRRGVPGFCATGPACVSRFTIKLLDYVMYQGYEKDMSVYRHVAGGSGSGGGTGLQSRLMPQHGHTHQ